MMANLSQLLGYAGFDQGAMSRAEYEYRKAHGMTRGDYMEYMEYAESKQKAVKQPEESEIPKPNPVLLLLEDQ